ncbi:alpha/beta hydrolase [Plantibacter sp. YIM 135347]|uniref:alpha/beta hydrolase n=1 Tax=Plantibacter sp. YIM 135347 TaxID=3423919 RepID=UPI003D33F4E8
MTSVLIDAASPFNRTLTNSTLTNSTDRKPARSLASLARTAASRLASGTAFAGPGSLVGAGTESLVGAGGSGGTASSIAASGFGASALIGSPRTGSAPPRSLRRLFTGRAGAVKLLIVAAALTAIVSGQLVVTSLPTQLASHMAGTATTTAPTPSTISVPTMDGAAFATAYAGNLSAAVSTLTAMSAVQVATVWTDLPSTLKRLLMTTHPEVIGNLEGVSYVDRATANVSRLTGLLHAAEASYRTMSSATAQHVSEDAESAALAQTASRIDALTLLADRYSPRAMALRVQPEYLVTLNADQAGPPRVAVAVGDVDTARYMTVFVPGMNSSALELTDYLRGVKRIQAASPDSAVLLWIGSRSPSALEVVSNDRAEAGAPLLAKVLGGYDAYRSVHNISSQLTVLAHSYGTATASLALASGDFNVDSFVMIGSAGIPTSVTIDDLHVPKSRVFASQASADALANLGQMLSGRANPTTAGWGATTFGSDGTTLRDGDHLISVEGHNAVGASAADDRGKYLGPGTESLYAIQRIAIGEAYAVPDERTTEAAGNPSTAAISAPTSAPAAASPTNPTK